MINSVLKNNLIPPEQYIFGTADLTGLIDKKFGEYRFGISIGKKLDERIIDSIANGPTQEYYDHYNEVNKILTEKAHILRNELRKFKIDSIVIEPTTSRGPGEVEKYMASNTIEVSHKMVATRAGLGWIGKTDLFVSREFGPRLRLISLLINKKPDNESFPINKSRCGTCTICADHCPASAANGLLWDIQTHRDLFYNARKCRDKCAELAKQRLNVDKCICGICVSVCPIGRKR